MPVSVPSLVHSTWLAPFPVVGHSGVLHASPWQARSHLHAFEHDTVSHAPLPAQVIVQRDPLWQSMSRHALPPVQLMVQVHPLGHVTLPQLSALVHSARQVRCTSSHVVQSFGQFETTQ
jgi:hypothetical protein